MLLGVVLTGLDCTTESRNTRNLLISLEARPGIEPRYTALQAVKNVAISSVFRCCHSANKSIMLGIVLGVYQFRSEAG